MKTKLLLSLVLMSNLVFSQVNKEFEKLPSGIYFKDGDQITALDPTMVNIIQKRNVWNPNGGRAIGQISGIEANYIINSSTKFYFKFKKEEKELNSSNVNSTDKVGEENYMNLIMSGLNSKAISPNEFKLIHFSIKKANRIYGNGKFLDVLGFTRDNNLDPKQIKEFKYKKIAENLFEVYFPNGIMTGEYGFVYLVNAPGLYSQSYQTKVFDFSVK